MQLNLFQWDLLEAGSGYKCLARLDFDQARQHFARILAAHPEHQAAGAGLRAVGCWEQDLQVLAEMQGEEAVIFFWKRLAAFSFGNSAADCELRTNLFRRLQALMEMAGLDYLPPDLCRGYLSLQLGDYVTAENQLRRLIESVPGEGILYGYLADTLWLQGRREIAAAVYATALLLDPQQMEAYALRNQRLAAIIAKHGAPMAPVYGFFHGVLPLVEQEIATDTAATCIYATILRGERARHRQDHAAMIAARRDLQDNAPKVFADYIRFMQAD
jgi:tetratricopeptide (TPR) repeat protein